MSSGTRLGEVLLIAATLLISGEVTATTPSLECQVEAADVVFVGTGETAGGHDGLLVLEVFKGDPPALVEVSFDEARECGSPVAILQNLRYLVFAVEEDTSNRFDPCPGTTLLVLAPGRFARLREDSLGTCQTPLPYSERDWGWEGERHLWSYFASEPLGAEVDFGWMVPGLSTMRGTPHGSQGSGLRTDLAIGLRGARVGIGYHVQGGWMFSGGLAATVTRMWSDSLLADTDTTYVGIGVNLGDGPVRLRIGPTCSSESEFYPFLVSQLH